MIKLKIKLRVRWLLFSFLPNPGNVTNQTKFQSNYKEEATGWGRKVPEITWGALQGTGDPPQTPAPLTCFMVSCIFATSQHSWLSTPTFLYHS